MFNIYEDASWKALLRDVAHIARVKVSANLHLHAYHQRVFSPDLTVWPCTLAGEGARALHDGGSQLNLISQRWATKNGLATPAGESLSITLGNGQQTTRSGQLTLKLQLQSFKDAIPCHIMKLPEQYDVILGDAFIRQTCAVTESDHQGLKCMTLKKGDKRLKVTRPESAKASEVTAPLLSAIQVAKAIRKKQDCFIIRVMPKDADIAQPAAAPAVLEDKPDLIPESRMEEIKQRFSTVLADELPAGLPPDRGVGHTIPLEEGAKPPCRSSRRLSPLEHTEVEAHMKKLLLNGHIEPSKSPFGATILFVQKKDGSLRMCLDCRALNKITIQNKFPLPRTDDLIDRMSGAKCFSSIDLASGYHRILIAPEDVP